MKIELQRIPIREALKGYIDREEEGVYSMSGRLNIRPIYQREFVYGDKERAAVINTVRKNFPLNVLYWVDNGYGSFEVLDGQQRLISIGQYLSGDYSIKWDDKGNRAFHNLTDDEQDQLLNYELMVYFCEGSHSEKLDWFRVINLAGKELTEQELKNAIFAGPWASDAKRYFSRTAGAASQIAGDYLKGVAKRQDYLETAIDWISNGDIEGYMSAFQHKENARELWDYFREVITWTENIFTTKRKEMKGVAFGRLFNEYKNNKYNPVEIEAEVSKLMQDEDVTKKPGIYAYIFTRNEKYLSIRTFTDGQKREAYERQKGLCLKCGEKFVIEEMEADHITPWSKGGRTISENCQMLCQHCNRTKSDV